jgi:hypothetical protein
MADTIDWEAILADERAQQAAWEATQTYKTFTIAALRRVFDAVCDPADWKGPITAVCTGEMVLITVAAIDFFTSTTPTVQLNPATMRYLIESVGYRQGPAGDH